MAVFKSKPKSVSFQIQAQGPTATVYFKALYSQTSERLPISGCHITYNKQERLPTGDL